MSGQLLLKNRRAFYEYEILKKYEAGLVLTGPEVKSLRHKSGSFAGSYVKIMSGEAWLINTQISPYKFANNSDYDPKRRRKLLLHKKEISELIRETENSSRTLVPLAFILKGNHIKLELAIARGKKQHDKRRALKEKAQKRDAARARKWSGQG
mgnify:CR=1 FL=1